MPDENAQHPLTEEERRKGILCAIWDGPLAATELALVGGVFLTGLALAYGATDVQVGLLASIGFVSGLVQLPAAAFIERFGGRKRITLVTAAVTRTVWVAALLMPAVALAWGKGAAVGLLLGIRGVAGLAMAVLVVAWLSWLGVLIPRAERGTQISRRNSIHALSSIVVALLGGWFLDRWQTDHGANDPSGFLILFAIGSSVGAMGIWVLSKIPEPPGRPAGSARRVLALLRRPVRDRNFLRLVASTAVRFLGWTLAGPFFMVYQIKRLAMPYTTITALQAIHGVMNAVGLQLWGRLSDRYGSRPVILVCLLGTVCLPLMWLLTEPGRYGIAPLIFFVGGLSWAGVTIGGTNLVLKLAPPGRNSTYIAVYTTVGNVLATIGPILGGLLLEASRGVQFRVGPVTFNEFKVLFVCSAVIRFLSALVLRPLKEPQELGVRRLVRALTHPRLPNPIAALHNLVASLSGGRVAVEEPLPTAPTAAENGDDAEAGSTPPAAAQGGRAADREAENDQEEDVEQHSGDRAPEQRGEQ